MADLKPFFDIVRAKFGNLSQSQVDGFNTVVDLSVGLPLEHRAYIIATAWHETAHTMQPIAEYGKGKGKLYGQPTGPYHQAYYGRGYVQLTWLKNYEKAAMATGAELVAHPDLALEPDIAGKILIEGMTGGWFTGVKLEMCHDYVSMRRVVNGTDCNSLIAGYAMAFELALKALPTPNPAAAESDLAPAAAIALVRFDVRIAQTELDRLPALELVSVAPAWVRDNHGKRVAKLRHVRRVRKLHCVYDSRRACISR
jgi:hypothetical protein